ncbi:MAG: hypothetical protein NZ700_11125 [Gemmataceae bacterium]|nr:hypothetical protein [Gemmataceae bacterium]MDW8265512.1 hypothetical protein [Gemmataceae bacterium]
MTTSLLILGLLLRLPSDTPRAADARPSHPLAPSLPLLTDKEEAELDAIIDRFIEYDIGKLKGEEGKKALLAFQKLGPEAIPALIRGLNRAAALEHSCPVTVIAKKLGSLLAASNDPQLLDFARESIGAGVGATRHQALLRDLRVAVTLRRNAVARKAPQPPAGPKPPRSMTTPELVAASASAEGTRLRQVLIELEQRSGDEVLSALASATADDDRAIQQLARDLLVRHLSRQPADAIRKKLQDSRAAVRRAAVQVVAAKGWNWGDDLIALLGDGDEAVRQSARAALVRLSGGTDFGPEEPAGEAERQAAVAKWRAWWERRAR